MSYRRIHVVHDIGIAAFRPNFEQKTYTCKDNIELKYRPEKFVMNEFTSVKIRKNRIILLQECMGKDLETGIYLLYLQNRYNRI